MSIRFQADADLNFDIVTAVLRRESSVDFASAVEAQLAGIEDPEVLELASGENRVLISHDHRTMLRHFRERLSAGQSSPGLLLVRQDAAMPEVVDAILLLWAVAEDSDLMNQVFHLPGLQRHVFR